VNVKFTGNMDLGISILRSSPHTRDIQIEDHSATVELATDDNGVAELLSKLVHEGAGLQSFGEKDPTLEDVFMLVTKGLVS
jgi:ABC-2 type transport system ATP-binding protein